MRGDGGGAVKLKLHDLELKFLYRIRNPCSTPLVKTYYSVDLLKTEIFDKNRKGSVVFTLLEVILDHMLLAISQHTTKQVFVIPK